MQQAGFNSDVNVGNRSFHVQTSFSKNASKIVSNIFENGRVVEAREVTVPEKQANGELEARLKELHRETIAEIELLFYIAEKVRHVRHPVSCNKLGLLLSRKGLYEEAIEFFRIALQEDSNLAEVYNSLGKCYLETHALEQAEKTLLSGLKIAGDFADLHLNLGRLYLEKEDFVAAYNTLQQCVHLNKTYFTGRFYLALAMIYTLQNGSDDPALPASEERIKLAQQHMDRCGELFRPFVSPHSMQARAALSAKDYASAIDHYLKAYDIAQPEPDLTFEQDFYVKFMYGGKGKDNAFIQQYIDKLRATIERHQNYADLRNHLGIAYLILCRNLFLKALDEFRAALKINPGFKRAQKNLKLAENDGKGFLILLRALLK